MEQKKSQAELQKELLEQLNNQNAQFMSEVAMPGVVMPVQNDKR